MGTSTSYRSPPTTRWNAVLASYRANLGVSRITSELFNAATVEGWLDHFQDGPLLHYARAVETLYYDLPDRLRLSQSGPRGLHSIVDATRSEALAEFGGDLSLAIGDRAFARVLMRQVREGGLQVTTPIGEVADGWLKNRPSEPASLVRQFLSEVLREFVLHVTIRDLPSLVGQVFDDPSEARSLSRELAGKAAALVSDEDFIDRIATDPSIKASSVWPEVMDEAFHRGRALLGNDLA
jgi:hypothetical protein